MHVYLRYLLTALVIMMLIIYPIVGGRGIQDAQVIVEIIAIITLIVFFIAQPNYQFLNKSQWSLLLLVVITPLIYLIPLPATLWESIPGRDLYIQIAHWLTLDNNLADINKTLSLIPYETEHAFFALLPPLAIFLVVVASPPKIVKILLYTALLITMGEALLAIIQYGTKDDYFYFGVPRLRENTAHGTYPNPDHLATLMFIMLPFALTLLIYNLRILKHTRHEKRKNTTIIMAICYLLAFVSFTAAAVFTSSRAGIALTFLALILTYFALARSTPLKKKLMIISTISMIAISIFAATNTFSVFSRLITENPFIDGRWQIFSNTYTGIQTFFPFGSGPGTFPDVYRLFQPIEQRGFINHAHNDYLELIFDTGLLGIIIIIGFFILFIKQWRHLPRAKTYSFRYIQVAASISLLLFLLHAIIEFNLHDVINLLFFALLMGIVFHRPDHKTSKSKSVIPVAKAQE